MSRPRLTGARGALSLALLASGAAVLSGCTASPAPSASPFNGLHATDATTASTNGTATGAADADSTSYTLALPSSIAGWTLTTPNSDVRQEMQQGLSQAEQLVGGVSGTPVTGIYDDTADQLWVAFVGLNGSGYDPARLAQAAETVPIATTDASGDRILETWVTNVSGGPHGGTTECEQEVISAGGMSTDSASSLAAEGANCFWMTPATFGVVTVYPQANRNDWDFGYDAQQMDGFMLKVRAAVEQPR